MRHGTDSCYVAGCRCLACCNARRDYKRDVYHNPADHRCVDASVVARRVRLLLDRGLSLQEIARRADVDRCTLARILAGRRKRVWRTTRDAIFGVAA